MVSGIWSYGAGVLFNATRDHLPEATAFLGRYLWWPNSRAEGIFVSCCACSFAFIFYCLYLWGGFSFGEKVSLHASHITPTRDLRAVEISSIEASINAPFIRNQKILNSKMSEHKLRSHQHHFMRPIEVVRYPGQTNRYLVIHNYRLEKLKRQSYKQIPATVVSNNHWPAYQDYEAFESFKSETLSKTMQMMPRGFRRKYSNSLESWGYKYVMENWCGQSYNDKAAFLMIYVYQTTPMRSELIKLFKQARAAFDGQPQELKHLEQEVMKINVDTITREEVRGVVAKVNSIFFTDACKEIAEQLSSRLWRLAMTTSEATEYVRHKLKVTLGELVKEVAQNKALAKEFASTLEEEGSNAHGVASALDTFPTAPPVQQNTIPVVDIHFTLDVIYQQDLARFTQMTDAELPKQVLACHHVKRKGGGFYASQQTMRANTLLYILKQRGVADIGVHLIKDQYAEGAITEFDFGTSHELIHALG